MSAERKRQLKTFIDLRKADLNRLISQRNGERDRDTKDVLSKKIDEVQREIHEAWEEHDRQ